MKTKIFIILALMFIYIFTSYSTDNCADDTGPAELPPEKDLDIPVRYQIYPSWCGHACVEMWARYKGIDSVDQEVLANDSNVCNCPRPDCGMEFYQIERAVRTYVTSLIAKDCSLDTTNNGRNRVLGIVTDALQEGEPSILITDKTINEPHAIIVKGFKRNEDFANNAYIPEIESISYNDPDTGSRSFSYYVFIYQKWNPAMCFLDESDSTRKFGLFYITGTGTRTYAEICENAEKGYLGFLKRCGTYYGGPEIYIPEGSTFLRVRYPQGNQTMAYGKSEQIIWESNNLSGQIRLEIFQDDIYKGTIAENLPIGNGSYTWTVGDYLSGSVQVCDNYRVKVSMMDNSYDDFSNVNFSMGSVEIATPNGGEAWEEGTLKNITWDNSYFTGNVKILLRKTIGATDYLIAEDVENTGIYEWTAGQCTHIDGDTPSGLIGPGEDCFKIKVISMDNDALMDSSNETFSIVAPPPPGITVTAPNGGENITQGLPYEITWTCTGIVGNVKIELSKDNGATYPQLVVESTANDGSYIHNVPETGVRNDNCLLRISEIDGDTVDVSNSVFTLLPPSITVLSPNGGESIVGGSTIEITWTGIGNIENVKIESSRNNGDTWQTVVESTENDGSYNFQVPIPGAQKDNCLIRISDMDGDPVDVSDAVFTVTIPGS